MKSSSRKPRGPGEELDYEIGYKKPPASHRFQKGQSGNPTGRPRRPKGFAGELEKLPRITLEEAYRPVAVRKGGKTTRIPAIRAVVRAKLLAGASGNQKAAKEAIALVQEHESRIAEQHLENLNILLDYKHGAQKLLERRKQQGLDTSDILPHPDDIIINPRTGEARIVGPMDEREKAFLEDIRRKYAELTKFLEGFENMLAITRSKKQKKAISAIIERTKAQLMPLSDFFAKYDSLKNSGD